MIDIEERLKQAEQEVAVSTATFDIENVLRQAELEVPELGAGRERLPEWTPEREQEFARALERARGGSWEHPQLTARFPEPEAEYERGPVGELVSGVAGGAVRLPQHLLSSVRAIANRLTPVKQLGPARKLQPHWTEPEYWAQWRETSHLMRPRGRMRKARPLGEAIKDYHWWTRNVAEVAPQMGVAVGARIVGGPIASFAFMAGLEGGAAYEEALATGADEATAAKEAFATGIVNGLLEMLPLEALVARVGKPALAVAKRTLIRRVATFLKGAATQAAWEGATEGIQELWQMFVADVGHKPTREEDEYTSQALGASLIGAAAGGLLGLGGQFVGLARAKSASRAHVAEALGVEPTELPEGLRTKSERAAAVAEAKAAPAPEVRKLPQETEPTVPGPAEAPPAAPKPAPEVAVEGSAEMTFDEFSQSRGVPRTPPAFPGLQRKAGGVSKQSERVAAKRVEAAMTEWQQQRDTLRAEYDTMIEAGELKQPSRMAQLVETARGEGQAAEAAQRLLAKQAAQIKPPPEVAAPAVEAAPPAVAEAAPAGEVAPGEPALPIMHKYWGVGKWRQAAGGDILTLTPRAPKKFASSAERNALIKEMRSLGYEPRFGQRRIQFRRGTSRQATVEYESATKGYTVRVGPNAYLAEKVPTHGLMGIFGGRAVFDSEIAAKEAAQNAGYDQIAITPTPAVEKAAPAGEAPTEAIRPRKDVYVSIQYGPLVMTQVGNKYIVADRTGLGASWRREYKTIRGAKAAFDKATKSYAKVMSRADWTSADNLIAQQVALPVEEAPAKAAPAPEAAPEVTAPTEVPPAEAPPIAEAKGAPTAIQLERGEVAAQWEVWPIEAVQASHTLKGDTNPNYPQGLQQRQREWKASKEQIAQMAQKLKPALLADSAEPTTGAPIVGPDLAVESGNARTMAVALAYKNARAGAYKSWLRENAERFGLTGEQIDAVKNPILVRRRTTEMSPQERLEFVREANVAQVAALSLTEQARTDAEKITPTALGNIKTLASGEMSTARTNPFVKSFLAQVPETERAALLTPDETHLNDAGLRRLRAALLARVYTSAEMPTEELNLLVSMVETGGAEEHIKNVVNALSNAAPAVAKLKAKAEAGRIIKGYDLLAKVREAIGILRKARQVQSRAGGKLTPAIRTTIGQVDLFRDPFSKEGRAIAKFFGENLSRPRRMSELLRVAAERLTKPEFDPTQKALPGMERQRPGFGVLIDQAAKIAVTGGQQELLGAAVSAVRAVAETADKAVAQVKKLASGVPLEWRRTRAREDTVPDAMKVPDAEVEDRIQRAHGLKPEGAIAKIVERVRKLWHFATRAQLHVPNDAFHAEANEIFRLLKNVPEMASDVANRTIASISDALGPKQFALFERKVLMDNLVASVERGEPLRFGFNTLEDAVAYRDKVSALMGQVPAIQEALAMRRKVVKAVRDDLVEYGILTDEQAKNWETYFRQQVLSEMEIDRVPSRRGLRRKKPGFAKARVLGEEMAEEFDYNTSYLEAEGEYLTEAIAQIEIEKLLAQLESVYDKAAEVRAEAKEKGDPDNWRRYVPEEYDVWQPQPGNVWYRAYTIPEKLGEALQQEIVKELNLTKEQVRTVVAVGGKRRQMVLPKTIVRQLDSMQKTRGGPLVRILKELMRDWKVWTLMKPKTTVSYGARNLTGDTDPIVAAVPTALQHVPRAIKELHGYYYGHKLSLSEELRDARNLAIITSGLTAADIPKLKELALFKRFYTEYRGGLMGAAARVPAKYFAVVRKLHEFREATLRYAAYLYYIDKINKGQFFNYGAAKKSVVDAIKDPKMRAAHLSRNLVGDYGNLTELGQWLRANLVPFYSWIEINAKRYPRLAWNVLRADGLMGARRMGGRMAVTVPLRVALAALTPLRVGLVYGLMWAWNHLKHPDEERELGPYDRANPHLILGRDPTGKIMVFRNVGALGDFLEWGGVNTFVSLLPQYLDGQISAGDLAKESAKSPVNKVVSGLRPEFHAGLGVLMGNATFPDVFNPRRIERMDAVLDAIQIKDEFNWTARTLFGGKRSVRQGYLARHFAGLVDPRKMALYEMYDLREKYLRSKGRPITDYRGISSIKNMREAAINGDFVAFKRSRLAYLKSGRAQKSFEASLRHLDPIAARLNDKDEWEFEYKFLNDIQRQRLYAARQFAQELRIKLWRWWLAAGAGTTPVEMQTS